MAETTGALVVATLAFVVALLTYATRTYFDHVDAWWKRTQWALHKALSDDELVAVVGLDAALVLVRARVPKRDRQVLQRAIVQIATGV